MGMLLAAVLRSALGLGSMRPPDSGSQLLERQVSDIRFTMVSGAFVRSVVSFAGLLGVRRAIGLLRPEAAVSGLVLS